MPTHSNTELKINRLLSYKKTLDVLYKIGYIVFLSL